MRKSIGGIRHLKVSDFVIDYLVEQKVSQVFVVAGGAIAHLLDSLYGRDDVECVAMHHEQAAAFAAAAQACVSGNIGVAMATSGPGATNLITGIGSAFFDSIPCLYITGQVNTYEYKFDRPVRQSGFQEADIVNMVKPITKYSVMVTNANLVKHHLQKAIHISKSGRPGPVLIDIPMDIQRAEVDFVKSNGYPVTENVVNGSREQETPNLTYAVELAKKLIESSRRPVVLAGGGVRNAKATNILYNFIEKTRIPVVVSLMGLDAFPHQHPSYCGFIGVYGNRYANLTLANCDLLLAIGTRLDVRQTGADPKTFAREAKIIHVEIDPNELNQRVKSHLPICCDAKVFLERLDSKFSNDCKLNIDSWIEVVQSYKRKYPSCSCEYGDPSVNPNMFMKILSEEADDDDILCLDVGQNQMWAAQSFIVRRNQRVLTCGGMGAMGFALPASIGASVTNRKRRVIVVAGDGGFQLNIHELQTIFRNLLPIKVFVMNNNCLGMVREFQEIYFDRRYQSTVKGYSSPSFFKIAAAYSINAYYVDSPEKVRGTIRLALSDTLPALVEVILRTETHVVPRLLYGRPIEDQNPLLDREEFKSNMIIKPLE